MMHVPRRQGVCCMHTVVCCSGELRRQGVQQTLKMASGQALRLRECVVRADSQCCQTPHGLPTPGNAHWPHLTGVVLTSQSAPPAATSSSATQLATPRWRSRRARCVAAGCCAFPTREYGRTDTSNTAAGTQAPLSRPLTGACGHCCWQRQAAATSSQRRPQQLTLVPTGTVDTLQKQKQLPCSRLLATVGLAGTRAAPIRCPRLVCQASSSSSCQQQQASSGPAALLQKAAALAAASALVLGSCGCAAAARIVALAGMHRPPAARLLTARRRPACSAPAALAEEGRVLCDASCASSLESREMVTTPSGLQYRDITVGEGPEPVKGFQVRPTPRRQAHSTCGRRCWMALQARGAVGAARTRSASVQQCACVAELGVNYCGPQVVAHYVAMTPAGRVFENSLEKGAPFDIRCVRLRRARARCQGCDGGSQVHARSRSHACLPAHKVLRAGRLQCGRGPGHPRLGRGARQHARGRRAAHVHPRRARLPQAAQGRGRQVRAHVLVVACIQSRAVLASVW